MRAKSIRVQTLPGGLVRVDLDDGATAIALEMTWRLALRLAVRLLPATGLLAQQEGLSDDEFDVLFDAETDQVSAEIADAGSAR